MRKARLDVNIEYVEGGCYVKIRRAQKTKKRVFEENKKEKVSNRVHEWIEKLKNAEQWKN